MEDASSIRSSSGNEVKFRPHELASSFEVSNSSSKYLAFKVQTTNIDLFLVSPNVGIVSPGEKRIFKVTRNLSGMSANGEKFRIIFVPVDEAAFIKYHQMKPKTSKNFKQEFGNELWKSENRRSLHLICIVDTSIVSPPSSPSEGENKLKIKSFLSLSWIKNVLVPNSPRSSSYSSDQNSSQSLSKDESMKLKDVHDEEKKPHENVLQAIEASLEGFLSSLQLSTDDQNKYLTILNREGFYDFESITIFNQSDLEILEGFGINHDHALSFLNAIENFRTHEAEIVF